MPKTLQRANRSAVGATSAIDKVLDRLDGGIGRAEREIEQQVQRKVRQMLATNYNRSGVETRTGKLLNSLRNVTVTVVLSDKPKLYIKMPAGMGAYKSGGNFYKAAAAVNYGAVRKAEGRNAREKKREKKKAAKKAEKTGADIGAVGGGLGITKGFHFWELTSSQKAEIENIVGNVFAEVVYR